LEQDDENYKYKFSVIIPIYNVEKYLKEAIDSVIKQTIGFKKNIQIILINDGSPDNSEAICEEYVEKYPDNIIYIKQKNAGVSAARNNGMQYIEGKYVSFLDADDKWEKTVFKKAYKMFEKNEDVDVIGVRIKFFEASNKFHYLDYKFNRDKVINILKEYNHLQLAVTSALFKASAIKDVRYDEKLKYAEDSKFIFNVLIKKCNLGIIASAKHLYRKRYSDDSAIQRKKQDFSWCTVVPYNCYKYAYEKSIEKFGKVISYVQYYVANEYYWALKEYKPGILDEETLHKYFEVTKELFKGIEDKIITDRLFSDYLYRTYFLSLKHKKDITKELIVQNNKLYYYDSCVYDFGINDNNKILVINNLNYENDELTFEGQVGCNIPRNMYKMYAITSEKKYEVNLYETNLDNKYGFDDILYGRKYGFNITLPINIKQIKFVLELKEKGSISLPLNFTTNSRLTRSRINYTIRGEKLLYVKSPVIQLINKKGNVIKFKFLYALQLLAKAKFKVLFTRSLYYILKPFYRKEIWIISDRRNTAGDNGMHLFKYLCEKEKSKNIQPYFTVDKNSVDYGKMKQIGKTVAINSLMYKLLFLMSEKFISSQADNWAFDTFGDDEIYYRNLLKFDFIFLQHGITHNDVSSWLHKLKKNIKKFITASELEYNSIVNGSYGYTSREVVLTGFPRYDNLLDEKENIIAIMPTWRSNLVGKYDKTAMIREYNKLFVKSDYFKFFSELLRDRKLIEKLERYGYKIEFVLHPATLTQVVDFKNIENEYISILKEGIDYQEIFKKSALLVTDYSSVAFDFAYLRKPVMYSQFDFEAFYAQHVHDKGYFDYARDGFGPVTDTYEDTINKIIGFIENDCKIDDMYLERINKFYKFNDRNNCKRVYDAILNDKQIDIKEKNYAKTNNTNNRQRIKH